MFKTLQHKFRYVLQGNIDDLVFMSEEGDIQLDETINKPFIMSGKWPHYMKNNTDTTKFTFAFGPLVVGVALSIAGINEALPLEDMQTPQIRHALLLGMAYIPAIMGLISIVLLMGYKLKESDISE